MRLTTHIACLTVTAASVYAGLMLTDLVREARRPPVEDALVVCGDGCTLRYDVRKPEGRRYSCECSCEPEAETAPQVGQRAERVPI